MNYRSVFVSTGSGYSEDRTQEDFIILADPVSIHHDRIFGGALDGTKFNGTDYGPYSLKLAISKNDMADKIPGQQHTLYILVRHGGGTETLRLPTFYDGGTFERALLAMHERVLYATLSTLYQTACSARDAAKSQTAQEWAMAHEDGRIKSTRRDGKTTVAILDSKPVRARRTSKAPA